eukprot:gene3860-4396_t
MENPFPTTTSDMQAMHIRSAAPKYTKPRKSNFQPRGETHKKQTKKTCYNCGFGFPHQHGPCPAQGKTCSYCNRKNHFTRCCKQRAKKQEQKVHTVATKESNTSSDESSDEYVYCMEKKMEKTKKLESPLIIKGQKVLFLVDTGASVNIMDENSFNEINRKTGTPIKLKQSKVRVYAYGSKTPLEMMGEFEETIETNQRITLAKFHVAKKVQGNLLSSTTAENLNLIKININHVQEKETKEEQKKPNPHDPAVNIKSEEYVSHLLDKHSNHTKKSGIQEGDLVLLKQGRKDKFTSRFNSNPYRVTEIAGTRITATRSDHEITRNTSFFKKYNPPDDENIQITNPDSEAESSDDENETEIEHEAVHQYPQRIRRMPTLYGEVYTH